MREVPRDEKFPEDLPDAAKETTARPSEAELVIITLLMRLYDVNLAILTHFDEKQAGEVYDSHNRGDHFNPKIYLPDMTPDDDR